MPDIRHSNRGTTPGLRVAVTDDHPLIVEAIAGIIRASNHSLVGTCTNSRELLNLLAREPLDAVTLDIGMPGLNGIDLAKQITANRPQVKIVFVTQQTDVTYVRAAFAAGASAFVAKQSSTRDLMDALAAVARGAHYVTPGLLDAQEDPTKGGRLRKIRKSQGLTPRQREVLQLVAEGKAAKEIAGALNISTKTVEFHKQALMGELNLRTTAELTRYALAHGLVFG